MSFIYVYQLRNAEERRQQNLLNYQQELESVIKSLFYNNLKEVIVEEKSFEFRLHRPVASRELRNMGKRIKAEINEKTREETKEKTDTELKYGFVRREQQLYAIVDEVDEETDMVSVEIVDAMVADRKLYSQRVNRFFEANNEFDVMEEIKCNYYLDVYRGEMKAALFKDIFNMEEAKTGDCYLLKAWHRYSENDNEDLKNNEIELDTIYDYSYLASSEISEIEGRNSFIVKKAIKKNKVYEKINTTLKLTIKPAEKNLTIIKDDKKKKINFCVHNVGQALATSFAYEGEAPFLYFDYGLPFGKNAFTYPGTILPVKSDTEIVISHLDTDHWNGLSKFKDAYKCSWHIADQPRKLMFNHKVAEIIKAGGSVDTVRGKMKGKGYVLSCGGTSAKKPTRPAGTNHETGLALCIFAKDNFNHDLKIVIEGDQDYDYVEKSFLTDVNILVACHHGGKYSWTVKADIPLPVSGNHEIVYSYGTGNTHRHPSKKKEYQAKGWRNEFDTAVSGNYNKRITFL